VYSFPASNIDIPITGHSLNNNDTQINVIGRAFILLEKPVCDPAGLIGYGQITGSCVIGISQPPNGTINSATSPTNSTEGYCKLLPTQGYNVTGSVWFWKLPNGTRAYAEITGLTPWTTPAIHVHEFGDITSNDGTSCGNHFNPMNLPHSFPNCAQRHAGDLGNIEAGSGRYPSVLNLQFADYFTVDGVNSIIGHSVIVHLNADNGSQPSGNAGNRTAQCVIGTAGFNSVSNYDISNFFPPKPFTNCVVPSSSHARSSKAASSYINCPTQDLGYGTINISFGISIALNLVLVLLFYCRFRKRVPTSYTQLQQMRDTST